MSNIILSLHIYRTDFDNYYHEQTASVNDWNRAIVGAGYTEYSNRRQSVLSRCQTAADAKEL